MKAVDVEVQFSTGESSAFQPEPPPTPGEIGEAPTLCSLGLLEAKALFLLPHTTQPGGNTILYTSRGEASSERSVPTNVTTAKQEESTMLPSMLLTYWANFLPRELVNVLSKFSPLGAQICSCSM